MDSNFNSTDTVIAPNYPAGFIPRDFHNNQLYQLDLPEFSGPLDLLLFLIHRERVAITDIPVAKITGQYLDYLSLMREMDIDVASEFLVMAAELLEIKAKMLLPKPELENGDQDDSDPRKDLAQRLLEYQKVKAIATQLENSDMLGREVFLPGTVVADTNENLSYYRQLDPYILVATLASIMQANQGEPVRLLDLTHLNVRKMMERLLTMMGDKETKSFSQLLPGGYKKVEKVVNFLAILELAKIHMVRLYQAGPQQEIFVVPLYRDMEEAMGLMYSTLEMASDDEELFDE